MIVENAAALQFILTEQIYLSKNDAESPVMYAPAAAVAEQKAEAAAPVPAPVIAEAPKPAEPATPQIAQQPVIAQAPKSAEAAPVIPAAQAISFSYLGKNAKNFLIVCYYPELVNMDEKHLGALTSTLQRKELGIDDVAIINLAQHGGATARQMHAFFKPARLLILGSEGILPGWDTLVLNRLHEKNGFKALYTDNFTDMLGDRDKTKAFWEQMKQL